MVTHRSYIPKNQFFLLASTQHSVAIKLVNMIVDFILLPLFYIYMLWICVCICIHPKLLKTQLWLSASTVHVRLLICDIRFALHTDFFTVSFKLRLRTPLLVKSLTLIFFFGYSQTKHTDCGEIMNIYIE